MYHEQIDAYWNDPARREELIAALSRLVAVRSVKGEAAPGAPREQVSLGELGGESVLRKLRMTDVNILSPIEALNLLAELKQDLNG